MGSAQTDALTRFAVFDTLNIVLDAMLLMDIWVRSLTAPCPNEHRGRALLGCCLLHLLWVLWRISTRNSSAGMSLHPSELCMQVSFNICAVSDTGELIYSRYLITRMYARMNTQTRAHMHTHCHARQDGTHARLPSLSPSLLAMQSPHCTPTTRPSTDHSSRRLSCGGPQHELESRYLLGPFGLDVVSAMP